ncbi:MAG: hypothetical protein AAF730_02505 [Bacteroidota bacterium]
MLRLIPEGIYTSVLVGLLFVTQFFTRWDLAVFQQLSWLWVTLYLLSMTQFWAFVMAWWKPFLEHNFGLKI